MHGHILAAENLHTHSATCGKVWSVQRASSWSIHCPVLPSQAYNITNNSPLPFWDFMGQILEGLGYRAPSLHLPYWLVYFLSLLLHLLVTLLAPLVTLKPTFTPMRVALAGTHHYYSCQQAQQDFAYSPPVAFQEGLRRTMESFAHLRKQQPIL